MKTIRFLSSILKLASMVLAWVYGISFIYALLVLLLHALFPGAPWVPIEINDGSFVILFPFTKTGFLAERLFWGHQLILLLILFVYTVFFWLLSRIFSAFSEEKIFTQSAVQALSHFSRASLTVPVLMFIIYAAITTNAGVGEALLAMVHWLLGVFTLFLAAIFKEGHHLQTEQDLTI